METAREVLSVLAVFALLGAALWTLRSGGWVKLRAMRASGCRRLESIERLPLTPNHALHLVRIGDQEMVVATHPQGCALLIENHNGEAR
ncbi:MAG TPA: flagellar biosynthetic protein FliO [Bryobacteraceae bacterium]|jgi:flagellar biogenesis protein FliO|nr:flagellar biosynthetic protein FliO [Bryobacteraceae bacterium]